jgi:subtilisin family serine protease
MAAVHQHSRRIAATAALSALLAGLLFALLQPSASAAKPSAGHYIVVLAKGKAPHPGEVASRHARAHGASVDYVYRHALSGYAATIPAGRVDEVADDPRVAYVERDKLMTVSAQTVPWGIDRIDADVSSTLAGNGSGAVSGVNAYVIDTGIDIYHPDLNVVRHVNYAGGKNRDCHGHGTHVAGTVAARDNTSYVVGAAPGAPLTGVKVLSCSGSGSTSGVIRGVDWVTANAVKPAVANMSLGGGPSQALDDAVKRSANSGVTYSIAAGNSGANACNESPARAGTHAGVVTTAATNSANAETSWSNYGPCVDLWAPGASILSTRKGGGTTTMSGTSMAAPHVAGTAGLYLSSQPAASPATVENALKASTVATGTFSKDGRAIALDYAGGF